MGHWSRAMNAVGMGCGKPFILLGQTDPSVVSIHSRASYNGSGRTAHRMSEIVDDLNPRTYRPFFRLLPRIIPSGVIHHPIEHLYSQTSATVAPLLQTRPVGSVSKMA